PQPAYVQGPPPPPPTEPPLSEPGTGPAKETVLPTGNISGKASGAPTSPPGPELITGTDPTPEAPAGATGAALGPNCNQPPSGRQARLRAENEIAVAYRESKNKSLSYGRLNDSGSSLSWDTNIYINSPSSLTDIRWPAVTSADLNGDGTYEALMAYQDKDDNLGVYVKKASGYDTWYSSWDRHHGSIAWIDVAAGRLIPWHSTTTDSPVLAFKDDKDDLEVVCLHGASNADIATTDSHWNARYWSDSSGRGNVDHVCVATGDLNGDGYDDEIVVAFQDSSYDLQVMAFRWEGGTSLTLLWEKRWTNYGRGYVAGDIYTARGIDVTTGDVDADFQDEVVVAFADGDYKFQLLLLNNVNTQGASAISLDDSTFVQLDPARGHELVWGEGATPKSVSVAAADVDGNGKDEVILAYGTYISKWWSGSGTFPHLMTFNYVRPGMGGLQERGHTQGSVALDYYGRMSLAAGDIDMDGRAEFAYARRTEGGDLEIKSFDAENNIVYHGGNSYSCSNCDVDELMLTMGDLNGDSSYGNYTNTCYETVETQVTAVLYVPPHYSEYNRLSGGVGSCAAIGKFVGSGSSNATGATTSNAGSVTIDESISFADIFEVGPSFTYEYESSLAVSNEQAVMRTDGLHWATDANADIYDLVAFDKVTYWVYEYTESRTGETYMLRIPKSSTPSTRRLDLWYSNGPTE
ncbi:MAG: hypothetical protein KJ734_05025, partial [Chloroflexi bacterium]|nr:hypothetical protein [Chloroflexota bacterium]